MTKCAHCLAWIPPEDFLILPDIKGHRKTYYFCDEHCQKTFEYLNRKEVNKEATEIINRVCLTCRNYFPATPSYDLSFCTPYCRTSFERQTGTDMIRECPNCTCRYLPHEEVIGEHGITFCSTHCRMCFEYKKQDENKMVDNIFRGTNALPKEPVLKLPRLTISDLFSLDNEEEFTRYLNDIIKEKQ